MSLFARLLLALYPRDFRAEYGDEWRELARRRSVRELLADAVVALPPLWTQHLRSLNQPRAPRASAMDTLRQDLRFGVRSLRKRPVFAAIAIATLGLGIGSATTMFSVVDAVLLDRGPFPAPHRLVDVWQTVPPAADSPGPAVSTPARLPWSFLEYRAWQAANTAFAAVAVHNAIRVTLTTGDSADRIWMGFGSASLLSVLGVQPALGRWFQREEEGIEPRDTPVGSAARVTVVSHELWRTRLGASPAALGATVSLDGRQYTVIGVLPAGFRLRYLVPQWLGADLEGRRDVWVPLGTRGLGSGSLEAIARLAPGVTDDQAIAETTRILRASNSTAGVRLVRRASDERQGLTWPLLFLLGGTGLLLFIGCANVAALSLGELVTRRRELLTRIALGAPMGRIARQLLTETLVLGVLGSLVGISLALVGTRLVTALGPPLPRLDAAGIDLGVLAFAVISGLIAVLASGTLPALGSARRSCRSATLLSAQSRWHPRGRLERAVVAAEVGMTVVLLVVGSLLGRSLMRLLAVDPGFDPAGLATVRIGVPPDQLKPMETADRLYTEIVDRLHSVPGVIAASASTRLPFPGEAAGSMASIVGRGAPTSPFPVSVERVLPGYFETLRIPLREGRAFTRADNRSTVPAVVISENLARRYWPNRSPIGDRLRGGFDHEVTIIGVAGDVKRSTLAAPSPPRIWVSLLQSQHTGYDMRLVARAAGAPAALLPAMRRAVRSIDSRIPVTEASTVPAFIRASASEERFRTLLMILFGTLGCLLAAVGLFGVCARSVAQRTREFGIRLALGAEHRRLIRHSLGESLGLGVLGLAFGLLVALALGRTVSGFLFGVASWDPVTYGGVAALVVAVVAGASFVPIRRIVRVAPADVLRDE